MQDQLTIEFRTRNSTRDRIDVKYIDNIPPPVLVLLAIVAIQLGAGLAINLFPVLGPEGTVAIRILFSAILLALAVPENISGLLHIFFKNWRILSAFGLCIATMNLFFYQAIDRIPLGAAVAFEFVGPLAIAALTSRKPAHFAWIALAALGIILLSPFSGSNLDPIGVLFALLAGLGWAMFIVLSSRVSDRVTGNAGLAIGMSISALAMLPFAIPTVPTLFAEPVYLLLGFGVALLSTTIPFTLEYQALRRIPKRIYGVLVSVEPAVAAIVGALLLGERIGVQGMIAVFFIVVAAAGITLTGTQKST